MGNAGAFLLLDGARTLPPHPTRAQVLAVRSHLQGMTVVTQQHGVLPWFPGAHAWLTAQDRQAVYAAAHALGDTHLGIDLPCGFPVYDEINQPFNSQAFPALDMTNGKGTGDGLVVLAQFIDIVAEMIANNTIPIVFCDERYEYSINQIQPLLRALKTSRWGDLSKRVLVMPGWDGVFYGWEPVDRIVQWLALAREIEPNCVLGLEIDPGHIPLGEGGADFLPGGRLDGLDAVFVEDADSNTPNTGNDTKWQIYGRLVRPFHRGPDQPAGDDPDPPFYLVDSPRGPRVVVAWERNTRYGAYAWVRGLVTVEDTETARNYDLSLGVIYYG